MEKVLQDVKKMQENALLGLLSELFSSFREIKAGNSGKAKLKEQIARK